MAKPTAEQLKLINKFAKEPLTEDNCYVHGFRMIGTRFIEDRYLKIHESLLDVYLDDVKNGDVVQIADHSMGGIKGWLKITLPFGRFFDGALAKEGEETHLDGYMYMKAGQKTYVEPFTTDDLSEQLDAGTLDDSSVGIAWDISECSICGNDIRDYDNCQHWPGRTYKVNKKDILCYVIAKPAPENPRAYMAENSLVGVGAYPDAGHLAKEGQAEKPKYQKVNDMMELKLIPKEEPVFCLFSANSAEVLTKSKFEPDAAKLHDMYHDMYQNGLPAGWTMRTLTQSHNEVVEKLISQQGHYLLDALDGNLPSHLKEKSLRREEGKLEINELVTQLAAKFKVNIDDVESVTEDGLKMKDGSELSFLAMFGDKLPEGKKTQAQIDEETGKLQERVDALEAEVERLKPLAKDGEAFRKEVTEEALAAGVRAQGNDFPTETWKKTFANMEIEAIRDIAKTFNKQAEEKIPDGRKTDPETGKNRTQKSQEVPDEAYKA